jgi:DNA-binding MarR family transcriptional regulator
VKRQRTSKRSFFKSRNANEIPGILLYTLTSLWRRKLNAALDEADLTDSQFTILTALARQTDCESALTQSDLAKHVQMSRALTSQIVRSLVRKKLISRTVSRDSRTCNLTFTAKGKQTVQEAQVIAQRLENSFWSETPELSNRLLVTLQSILRHHAVWLDGRNGAEEKGVGAEKNAERIRKNVDR